MIAEYYKNRKDGRVIIVTNTQDRPDMQLWRTVWQYEFIEYQLTEDLRRKNERILKLEKMLEATIPYINKVEVKTAISPQTVIRRINDLLSEKP